MRDNYFTYCMNKEEKWMGYKLGQSSIRPLSGRQRLREIIFDESVDIWNVALTLISYGQKELLENAGKLFTEQTFIK